MIYILKLGFYYFRCFAGSQDGWEIVAQKIWNKRCNFHFRFSHTKAWAMQVPKWMKETDEDSDGRLSYKEFKAAILPSAEDDET